MHTNHDETITPRSRASKHTTKPKTAKLSKRPVPGASALPQAELTTTDRPFLLLETRPVI